MPAIDGIAWRISLNTSARPGVVPVEAHAARELLDDPQIRLRIARRVERFAAELHHAIGVGDRAVFLGPRGRGQDDVGVDSTSR